MSVIFMDSFQHYATADILKKWTSVLSAPLITAGVGRRAGKALEMTSSDTLSLNLGATYSGLIAGFAAKYTGAPNGSNLFAFTENSAAQVEISVQSDGVLKAYRGSYATGTLLGFSAPGAVPVGSWFFIEISAVFDNAAGAVAIKINGSTVLTLTGIDTVNTANAYATGLQFSLNASAPSVYVNDFYLIDPATAPNTSFLGDVRVDAYYPTTDGASSQWTPTPSGAHYATVDETAPNGTDEIEADVTGYIDLFGFQDLAVAPGAFYAVQVCAAAIKTDAGSRQVKSVVRRGVTNYPGTAKDVSETQKYILNQWNTDPSTAAAWTKAGFDAAEFGVELV